MNKFNSRRTWGPEPRYPQVLAWPKGKPAPLTVVAGPCSVEGLKQMTKVIPVLKSCGVSYARGGVYRAGTYPSEHFGLQFGLAQIWSKKCHDAGLRVVMECLDISQIDFLADLADAIQVGARHMQDYTMLRELSWLDKPVFLKRNMGATLDEFLGAAEYLARGRCSPIFVERGSATHANHVRWDLSMSLIAAVKRMTGLPILVDASHGTGRRDLVHSMTMAGIAAGADGFIVEIHPKPDASISDSDQAYPLSGLNGLIHDACGLAKIRSGWRPAA